MTWWTLHLLSCSVLAFLLLASYHYQHQHLTQSTGLCFRFAMHLHASTKIQCQQVWHDIIPSDTFLLYTPQSVSFHVTKLHRLICSFCCCVLQSQEFHIYTQYCTNYPRWESYALCVTNHAYSLMGPTVELLSHPDLTFTCHLPSISHSSIVYVVQCITLSPPFWWADTLYRSLLSRSQSVYCQLCLKVSLNPSLLLSVFSSFPLLVSYWQSYSPHTDRQGVKVVTLS